MGDKVALTVEERKVLGKKVAKLRKEGMVPAVVYGQGVESVAVMAPATTVTKVWREVGGRQPVELTIGDGAKRLAMIKSAEFDPVKRSIRHLSFHVVKMNEKVETQVPVRIQNEGETAAERAGLVVLQAIESVEISAFPNQLPEEMFAPSDKLVAEGDHITVADITPIDGVEIITEKEILIATVYEPGALAAKNAEAAGDDTDAADVPAENGAVEVPAGDVDAKSQEEANKKKADDK